MAILLPALAFPLLVVLVGTLATPRSEDSGGWERPLRMSCAPGCVKLFLGDGLTWDEDG